MTIINWKGLALELIDRGAEVYAGARNPPMIDFPGAIPVQLDITDPNAVAEAAKVAGDLTLLINNAGISSGTDLMHGKKPMM